jgi:hypothetical protein
MTNRLRALAVVALLLGVVSATPQAQSVVTAQINNFWNLLRFGSTSSGITYAFNNAAIVANGYLSYGTLRGVNGYGVRDNNGTIEIKNNGGAWTAPAGGANGAGTYIVQTSTNAPANAQILGVLASGLVFNTTGTGVLSIYPGSSACVNQFVTTISSTGTTTCASVTGATISGQLPAANFPALTGDITTPGASLVTTLATTGVGAGTVGSATAIPQITFDAKGRATVKTTVSPQLTLTGTFFSSLSGANLTALPAAQLTGTILAANFPALTGDVTSAGATLATTVGQIGGKAVSLGGALTFSGAFATVLTVTAPTNLTLPTAGTLVTTTVTALASLSTVGTISTGVWNGTAITVPFGGTGATTLTAHGILLGEGTGAITPMAVCTNGTYVRGATGADPICSTLVLPNAATQGDLMVATGANTIGSLADVAVGQVLASGGVGTVPAYTASPLITTLGATTSTVVGGTAVAGAATTTATKTYATTGLADGVSTPTFTVSIPNAAQSANLHVRVAGSLGAGGAIGANECTNILEGNIVITRTTGVATVATAATAAITATSCVAGATTETLAYAVSAVAGGVGATQTFTVNVTVTKGGGGSNNHTVMTVAELQNANASGVTLQ